MFCTNCGKELLDGAKFCSACGARVEADVVDPTISYVSDKPSFEEDAPVKRPVTNKVVFDWSNVIDEPLKKETANVESPWVSEKPAKTPVEESVSKSAKVAETENEPGKIRFTDDDSFLAELGKPSTDPGRTMSFIDILKQEREEREQHEAKSMQSEAVASEEPVLKTPEDAYSDYLNARGTADEEKAQHDYEETVRAAAPKIYEPEEIKIREFVAPEPIFDETEEDDEDLVEIDFSEPEVAEEAEVPASDEADSLDDFVIETLDDEDEEEEEAEELVEEAEAEEVVAEDVATEEPATEEVEPEAEAADDFEVEYEGDDEDDEEESSSEEMLDDSKSDDEDDSYEHLNFDYLTMEESDDSEEDSDDDDDDDSDDFDDDDDDDEDDDEDDDDDDDEVVTGKHGRASNVAFVAAEEENVESEIEALKRRLAELLGEDEEELELPKKETVSVEEIVGEEPVEEAAPEAPAEEVVAEEVVEEPEVVAEEAAVEAEETTEEPAEEVAEVEAEVEAAEAEEADAHEGFVSVTVADLIGEDVVTSEDKVEELSVDDLVEEMLADVSEEPAEAPVEEVQPETTELDDMLAELLGDMPSDAQPEVAEEVSPELDLDLAAVAALDVEPEEVAPVELVEEETDAMTIEELERDLFGDDFASDDADAEATKKIDRFYTLYKKNEEFQQLLNDEYNKLNNPDLEDDDDLLDLESLLAESAEEPAVSEEPVAEKAIEEPVAEEPAKEEPKAPAVSEEEEEKPLSKKELKAKKKAEKAAKRQAELEEEDDDEEEGGNALTIIAVIIAAVLVVLLVVILILNFFPDSGAASAIGSVLEKLTGLIAAGEFPGGGFLL